MQDDKLPAQAIHQRDVAKGKPIPQMENYEATSGEELMNTSDVATPLFQTFYQMIQLVPFHQVSSDPEKRTWTSSSEDIKSVSERSVEEEEEDRVVEPYKIDNRHQGEEEEEEGREVVEVKRNR